MRIEVKFSGSALSQYAARVHELGAQGQTEMARGLNDAGAQVLTQVRRALKTQMGVLNQGIVNDATGGTKASPGGLVYSISGRGKGLPIKDFPVEAAVCGPVTAEPWGVSHTFARSFKTSGKGLLRARRGQAREPIRSLRGPAPAKELVKDESAATFEAGVEAIVEPIVLRRLARLMP